MKLRIAPILTALALLGGFACKGPKTKVASKTKKAPENRTATELVDQAELMLQRKQWQEGRKLLRIVEENLPSSKEYPRAKMLIADSFFFCSSPSYPEAQVEYQSFLTYFPQNEKRAYALYHAALCHYASIENAERDQAETHKAIESFQKLIDEAPGSLYAVDAKAKVTQCWRRLAEAELTTGIFYVMVYPASDAGEKRIKNALEAYPDYIDRERAYFYLGEVMRQRLVQPSQIELYGKDYLARIGRDDFSKFTREESKKFFEDRDKFMMEEINKYRAEARNYYQKLVESYPNSSWTGRAKDRLIEMGQTNVKEELDS